MGPSSSRGGRTLLPTSTVEPVTVDDSKLLRPSKLTPRAEGQINTLDVWKVFAVVTMMIDHFGLFGFHSNIMWRLVGRVSAPTFYFMVGLVHSKRVSLKHLFWVGMLHVVNAIYGLVIPLSNSLVSILLSKVILRFLKVTTIPWMALIPLQACLILSYSIVQPHLEYGTLCILHAIGGDLVRARHRWMWVWVPVTCGYHFHRSNVFYTYRGITSDWYLGIATFIGLTVTYLTFTMKKYGPYDDPVRQGINAFMFWVSRHALEIYVVHLCCYKFHLVHSREWRRGY